MWIEEEKVREDQQHQLALQAPSIDYINKVLDSSDSFPVRDIAKELGYTSIALNKLLELHGIQFNQSGQWFLKAKYQDKGYTTQATHQYEKTNGIIGTRHSTRWLQKGRKFIHTFINNLTN